MHHSVSGGDVTWTVGSRYAPIRDFSFRGNFTHAIRSPSIQEAFIPTSTFFGFATDPCDRLNLNNGPNPAARQANCAAAGIPSNFNSDADDASFLQSTGGNPNLKNERAREWEVGTEVGFLGGKASAEATYYNRLVSDLLFFRPLPTSTGFSRQFYPIGTMSNKGVELLLRTTNVDAPNLTWTSTMTYAHNKNLVESLKIQDFQSAGGYPNRIRAEDQFMPIEMREQAEGGKARQRAALVG